MYIMLCMHVALLVIQSIGDNNKNLVRVVERCLHSDMDAAAAWFYSSHLCLMLANPLTAYLLQVVKWLPIRNYMAQLVVTD